MTIEIKKEIQRKLIHLSSLYIPICYCLTSKNVTIIIASLVFTLTIANEILRRVSKVYNAIFILVFSPTLREKEIEDKNIVGATYFSFSSLVTVLLFERNIAIFSLFVLIISDTSSAIIGKIYGKNKIINNTKSIEGAIGFMLSGILIYLIYNLVAPIPVFFIVGVAVSCVAELFSKVTKIDDNILIPFSCGLSIVACTYL